MQYTAIVFLGTEIDRLDTWYIKKKVEYVLRYEIGLMVY